MRPKIFALSTGASGMEGLPCAFAEQHDLCGLDKIKKKNGGNNSIWLKDNLKKNACVCVCVCLDLFFFFFFFFFFQIIVQVIICVAESIRWLL